MKRFFQPLVAFAFAFVLMSSSCAKHGTDDGNDNDHPSTKGYVSGKVTDSKGQPIAGAQIVVNNTLFFNKNIVLTSDNNGNYKYHMPINDTWYVRGSVKLTYHNIQYEMPLDPDFSGSFSGDEGKVVNLRLKLSGAQPTDFGGSGYYGGTVILNNVGSFIDDMEHVQLTLTPTGPLLDGSNGTTIVKIPDHYDGGDGYQILDVPIGRYTITAKSAEGHTVYLQDRTSSASGYQSSLTLDFTARPSNPQRQQINLSLSANQ